MVEMKQVVTAAPGWNALFYLSGAKNPKEAYTIEPVVCWTFVQDANSREQYGLGMVITGRELRAVGNNRPDFIAYLDPDEGISSYMDLIRKMWDKEQVGGKA